MLYLLLAAILLVWALFTVAREPLRPYFALFALLSAPGHLTELITSGTLRLYEFRGGLSPYPFQDSRILATLAEYVIFPLFASLFCYYAARRSNWWILGASLILSGIEIIFLRTGQLVYFRWNLLYSFLFYPPFFWLSKRVFRSYDQLPLPLVVYGTTLALCLSTDLLLHGAFLLWHYDVLITRDLATSSRLAGAAYCLVTAAFPLLAGTGREVPFTQRVVLPVGALLALSGMTATAGLRVFDRWGWLPEAVKVSLIVLAVDRLGAWYGERSRTREPAG